MRRLFTEIITEQCGLCDVSYYMNFVLIFQTRWTEVTVVLNGHCSLII
jgi:hypothetical protein